MAAVASTAAAAAATLRLGDSTNNDSNLRHLKKREKMKNRFLKKDDFPGQPPFLDRPNKPIDADIIEGTYLYTSRCGLVFQATIGCGGFGDDDDDLCLYSEFSLGKLSNSTEGGAVPLPSPFTDTDTDTETEVFLIPNPDVSDDGSVDENVVCVFSGAFRKSSAFGRDDNDNTVLKALPLASSNGCQTTTKNFQLVVKGTVSEDEDDGKQIELEFSDDFGESYYTDDKECPLTYVAFKLDDDEVRRSLAVTEVIRHVSSSLAAIDENDKSIDQEHRSLIVGTLFACFFTDSCIFGG